MDIYIYYLFVPVSLKRYHLDLNDLLSDQMMTKVIKNRPAAGRFDACSIGTGRTSLSASFRTLDSKPNIPSRELRCMGHGAVLELGLPSPS